MQMEILIFRSAAISKSIENYSPIATGYEAQSWKRREYRFPESTIDSAYDHCLGGSLLSRTIATPSNYMPSRHHCEN